MEQKFLTVTLRDPEQNHQTKQKTREIPPIYKAAVFCCVLTIILGFIAGISDCIQRGKELGADVSSASDRPEKTAAVIIETSAWDTTQDIQEPNATEVAPESRYAAITAQERDLIARIVYLEARGEPAEGQQAVAEVILNRVAANNFPNTVQEVIFQDNPLQFSTAPYVEQVIPEEAQYDAVDAAMYGEAILPMDVVYFSTTGENGRVWGTIGGHVFCYQYIW